MSADTAVRLTLPTGAELEEARAAMSAVVQRLCELRGQVCRFAELLDEVDEETLPTTSRKRRRSPT